MKSWGLDPTILLCIRDVLKTYVFVLVIFFRKCYTFFPSLKITSQLLWFSVQLPYGIPSRISPKLFAIRNIVECLVFHCRLVLRWQVIIRKKKNSTWLSLLPRIVLCLNFFNVCIGILIQGKYVWKFNSCTRNGFIGAVRNSAVFSNTSAVLLPDRICADFADGTL